MEMNYESEDFDLSVEEKAEFYYDPSCVYCRHKNMTPKVLEFGRKLERYMYNDIINLQNEEGIRRLLIDKGTLQEDAEMISDGKFCLEQMYEFNRRFDDLIKYFEEQILKEMGIEGIIFIDEIRHRPFIPKSISADLQLRIENMSLIELYVKQSIVNADMTKALRRAMLFEYSDFLPYYNAIEAQIKFIESQPPKSWVDTEDEEEY